LRGSATSPTTLPVALSWVQSFASWIFRLAALHLLPDDEQGLGQEHVTARGSPEGRRRSCCNRGFLATALGEEIGWRGFLVPELFKTMGFTSAALFSGVVWACWHYPLVIWGDCSGGTPVWYGLTYFTVLVYAKL